MSHRADIANCENRLRLAMLTGDVEQLDQLLSNTLVFTTQDGQRLSKDDDLAAHRSGLLRISKLDYASDLTIRELEEAAIVCVSAIVAGTYAGQPFSGTFAYTRVSRRSGQSWRVEAGHCSSVRPDNRPS